MKHPHLLSRVYECSNSSYTSSDSALKLVTSPAHHPSKALMELRTSPLPKALIEGPWSSCIRKLS